MPQMLYEPLPDTLTVGGRRYPLHTDFRVGLLIRDMWCDRHLTARPVLLWRMTFFRLLGFAPPAGEFPENPFYTEGARAVLTYMNDGRVPGGGGGSTERLLSYRQDAGVIYASFLQAYGIDLSAAALHLWQFDALCAGLPADSPLGRLLSVRATPLSVPEDDAARAALAAQKVLCRIRDAEWDGE